MPSPLHPGSDFRLAALADIHGNLAALQAVAAELKSFSPDLTVNLGDHLSGPLAPAATADFLIASSFLHIRGNHDRQLLDRPFDALSPSDRAASLQLQPRHFDWLASLPPTLSPEPGLLLCHGTPTDDLQYLAEHVTPSGVALAPPHLIQARLGPIGARLVLCAHSHLPRVTSLNGGTLVVNPGSVGLPAYDASHPFPHFMEAGTPHARFAILDRRRGHWQVSLLAVPYDWTSASALAAQSGRPDWAHALLTGYALRS